MKVVVFADEKGTSMVELLVSVAIIAIVLTTFLAALSTANFGVATVRERVTAANLARAQLECIQDLPYVSGADPFTYTTACAATQLSTYPMELSISYWHAPTEAFTSTPGLDEEGMQWITMTVSHKGEPVFTIGNYKVDR